MNKKEGFPDLECPICEELTKPFRVNKDGSVRYICKNKFKFGEGGTCGEKHKFTITENGDLKD